MCWTAGVIDDLAGFRDAFAKADQETFDRRLRAERQQFGLVITDRERLWAAVDRISGYPLFFGRIDDTPSLATDTRPFHAPEYGLTLADRAIETFLATGYTFGSDTLSPAVRRLLPGEWAAIGRDTADWHRYYTYTPDLSEKEDPPEDWMDRLDAALTDACRRTIARADGRRILLAMSAGYDSRALLATFDRLQYDRLETFSYGAAGNMEAEVGRAMAERAGVKWFFANSRADFGRADFAGPEGDAYMLYAGGLSAAPSLTEYPALRHMALKEMAGPDDLLVNGQTGDFISGGHLPEATDTDALIAALTGKHLALMQPLHRPPPLGRGHRLLTEWTERHGAGANLFDAAPVNAMSAALTFEWQERQSGYVMNQHRAHDFLGLDWATPLWDADIMDLFATVPLSLQRRQKLYLDTLKRHDRKGLFSEGRRVYRPWGRHGWLVRSLARCAGLIGGAAMKNRAYDRLRYYSDLNVQYRLYGPRLHGGMIASIRNPVSLSALDYLYRLNRLTRRVPTTDIERQFAALRDSS